MDYALVLYRFFRRPSFDLIHASKYADQTKLLHPVTPPVLLWLGRQL